MTEGFDSSLLSPLVPTFSKDESVQGGSLREREAFTFAKPIKNASLSRGVAQPSPSVTYRVANPIAVEATTTLNLANPIAYDTFQRPTGSRYTTLEKLLCNAKDRHAHSTNAADLLTTHHEILTAQRSPGNALPYRGQSPVAISQRLQKLQREASHLFEPQRSSRDADFLISAADNLHNSPGSSEKFEGRPTTTPSPSFNHLKAKVGALSCCIKETSLSPTNLSLLFYSTRLLVSVFHCNHILYAACTARHEDCDVLGIHGSVG
jgi:hypothetical protein